MSADTSAKEKSNEDEEGETVYRMQFINGESRSFYVVLIYADNPTIEDKSSLPTVIDISKNPLKDVDEHNQGMIKHRFTGKNSGAMCKIQQILGPFDTIEKATAIQEEWKKKARGLVGRGAHGRELHLKKRIPLWDAHCDLEYGAKRPSKRPNKRKSSEDEN